MEKNKTRIRLKAARVNAGLSQEEAARIAGVSTRMIRFYESGTVKVPLERLLVLSEAYGFPLVEMDLGPAEGLEATFN